MNHLADIEDNDQPLPPWKRQAEDSAPKSAQPDSEAEFGSDHRHALSSSENELDQLARANERASSDAVVQNFENLFFHDDFFRLVGIGVVGGFGASCILIVVVLEFTNRQFAETFPRLWYVFPTLTIVGFVAWTMLLLKVRIHRREKLMRKLAFGETDQVAAQSSKKKEDSHPSGPRHSEADEEWL